MAVGGGFVSIDYRVVAVDSYCSVTMWDRESEDLLVKFFFVLHKFKESNNTPYRQGYAVSILSVYNIKCRGTALNLTC